MERNPWLRALIILGVLVLGDQVFTIIWNFGRHFADIILIFFLAWLLAFLLDPVVNFLCSVRNFPRVLAVGTVYLGLLAVLVFAGVLLIPPTTNQVAALGHNLPQYGVNASKGVDDVQQWLHSRGVAVNLQQATTNSNLSSLGQQLGSALAGHALQVAQSVLVGVLDGVIVLVLSFYIMLDGPRITRAVLQVIPQRFRDDVQLLFASVDHSFGGYLRASLVIAVVYALGTAMAMYGVGAPFALPVSVFAGLMLVVPFVGDIVAVVPPILIALFTVPPLRVVILLILMIVLQQLVLQVLRPKIMGRSVGLHPLWVLASFLIGAKIAGIWGALFSVPIAAIGQTIVQLYYYRVARNPVREDALTRSLRGHAAPASEEPPAPLPPQVATTPTGATEAPETESKVRIG